MITADADRAPLPTPALAVVVPFFNESENVTPLADEIADVLAKLALSAEVIFIDDGSSDGTAALLDQACAARSGWQVLHFSHNQGQAAALYVGLHSTRAARIALLDGDGQNDPADIPALLALLDQGADLAVGVRANRRDNWGRRQISRLANAVRRRLLNDGVRDTGCGIKALRREVIAALIPLRTLYSFIPAMAAAGGFRVVEQPVNHRPRGGNESKYSVRRFMGWPFFDMFGMWWFGHRRCAVIPPSPRSSATTPSSIVIPTTKR